MRENIFKPFILYSYLSILVFISSCTGSRFITGSNFVSNGRVGHGEPCSDTGLDGAQCQIDFSCYQGTCQCPHPKTSIYEGGHWQPCRVLADERCIYKYGSFNSRTGSQYFLEELPCVENSQCQTGFCTCLAGFYKVENGTCERQLGFGAKCDSDLECESDRNMTCDEESKSCDCNKNINEFSSILCAVSVYGNCSGDGVNCVKNANCGGDGICECNSGYVLSGTGLCQRIGHSNFNEACEKDDDCHSDDNDFALICSSQGRCDCSGSRPVFSRRERNLRGGVCVQKLGGDCFNDQDCGENTECKWEGGAGCTCKDSFVAGEDGSCQRKEEAEPSLKTEEELPLQQNDLVN